MSRVSIAMPGFRGIPNLPQPRRLAERDEIGPEVGPRAGPHGSNNLPGMAAVCRIATSDQAWKKNVRTGRCWRREALWPRTFFSLGCAEALRKRTPDCALQLAALLHREHSGTGSRGGR